MCCDAETTKPERQASGVCGITEETRRRYDPVTRNSTTMPLLSSKRKTSGSLEDESALTPILKTGREAGGRLGVGQDDIEVLEAEILEWERRRRLCHCDCRAQNATRNRQGDTSHVNE